ncbi:predicted protein [Botrytis cinerea T4]|uniref:Uncharacterized protein n=1 Tax=Botryotinia fuckeliana (strain T4) TaxID=999810 RepID=G2YS42_BOTF4|nr:predicted protein [Botrytis cinerea T4]
MHYRPLLHPRTSVSAPFASRLCPSLYALREAFWRPSGCLSLPGQRRCIPCSSNGM